MPPRPKPRHSLTQPADSRWVHSSDPPPPTPANPSPSRLEPGSAASRCPPPRPEADPLIYDCGRRLVRQSAREPELAFGFAHPRIFRKSVSIRLSTCMRQKKGSLDPNPKSRAPPERQPRFNFQVVCSSRSHGTHVRYSHSHSNPQNNTRTSDLFTPSNQNHNQNENEHPTQTLGLSSKQLPPRSQRY